MPHYARTVDEVNRTTLHTPLPQRQPGNRLSFSKLGEHDEASDSDGERGDAKDSPGPLPQDHSDLRRIRVAERRRRMKVCDRWGEIERTIVLRRVIDIRTTPPCSPLK